MVGWIPCVGIAPEPLFSFQALTSLATGERIWSVVPVSADLPLPHWKPGSRLTLGLIATGLVASLAVACGYSGTTASWSSCLVSEEVDNFGFPQGLLLDLPVDSFSWFWPGFDLFIPPLLLPPPLPLDLLLLFDPRALSFDLSVAYFSIYSFISCSVCFWLSTYFSSNGLSEPVVVGRLHAPKVLSSLAPLPLPVLPPLPAVAEFLGLPLPLEEFSR